MESAFPDYVPQYFVAENDMRALLEQGPPRHSGACDPIRIIAALTHYLFIRMLASHVGCSASGTCILR